MAIVETPVFAPQAVTWIRPDGKAAYWREVWKRRELLFFLTWRDVLVRYKQTAIGITWVLLRPLIGLIAFTFVFGKLAKLPSEGVPYMVLVVAGVLPWQFFSTAVSEAGASLTANVSLVSKVYFPRMILPLSGILVACVDFLASLVILVGVLGWYGVVPDWRVLALPLVIAFGIVASGGVGIWLAALNVKYRDFRYVLPFVVQVGMYVSPVGFTSALVPEEWRIVYSLNPMVAVIDGFRWALFAGKAEIYWPGFMASTGVGIIMLLAGIWYFRRTENHFADII